MWTSVRIGWRRLLVRRGVGPEDVVAVGIPRCVDSVGGPLGGCEVGGGFRTGRSGLIRGSGSLIW